MDNNQYVPPTVQTDQVTSDSSKVTLTLKSPFRMEMSKLQGEKNEEVNKYRCDKCLQDKIPVKLITPSGIKRVWWCACMPLPQEATPDEDWGKRFRELEKKKRKKHK